VAGGQHLAIGPIAVNHGSLYPQQARVRKRIVAMTPYKCTVQFYQSNMLTVQFTNDFETPAVRELGKLL
jgi:hypothetical protein